MTQTLARTDKAVDAQDADRSPDTIAAVRSLDTNGLTKQNQLATDEGKISIAHVVVQKIAGMACREMPGVYAMGTGGSRAFGAIRERIPGSAGPNAAQGVTAEVGETQAAIDLDIVVEYGVSITDLGRAIQHNVKQAIQRMTGLSVIEVNISVDDVHLPELDEDHSESRVS